MSNIRTLMPVNPSSHRSFQDIDCEGFKHIITEIVVTNYETASVKIRRNERKLLDFKVEPMELQEVNINATWFNFLETLYHEIGDDEVEIVVSNFNSFWYKDNPEKTMDLTLKQLEQQGLN